MSEAKYPNRIESVLAAARQMRNATPDKESAQMPNIIFSELIELLEETMWERDHARIKISIVLKQLDCPESASSIVKWAMNELRGGLESYPG